jgi:hypothetical protein
MTTLLDSTFDIYATFLIILNIEFFFFTKTVMGLLN